MFDKIIEACQFLLQNYPDAQDCKTYLDSRLTEESQNKFQFGYFPNTFNIKVLTSMIGEDTLKDNKLFYSRDISDALSSRIVNFSYFEDYPLIMPFKDAYGQIIALVGRSLLSDQDRKSKNVSKYKNTVFPKGNYLFGLYENKESIVENNMVYIVEGQFDVIKANEKGLKNVVGLGNSNLTAYQFSLISRYTDNLILLLDNDEAGEKGRSRIVDKFGKFANIQNFYLPDGYKDIDEYLSTNSLDNHAFVIKI
jgi:DNA primase